MGKIKDDVNKLVKELRGKDVAIQNTRKWFKNTKASAGDTSVKSTSSPFKPGKIYVFRYEKPKDNTRLWDRNPVVLSLGTSDGLDVGINLNFLPYAKRLDLLDRVYEQYKSITDAHIKSGGTDAVSQKAIVQMTYENVNRFLEKSGYMSAFRRYVTNKRKNTAIIGYSMWNRAVLLEISDISSGDINKAYSKLK